MSASIDGNISGGAARDAVTGIASWSSLSEAAKRRLANITAKPHRNVAAISRKLGSMRAHLDSNAIAEAWPAYLSRNGGKMNFDGWA
jgi:hypothetical protein